MSTEKIRVRFAPSPTGYLHIGSLRVAIFNWLFARHHNGLYMVRIEDTDRERSQLAYTQAIYETLAWADLSSDESAIIQSERIAVHDEYIQKLMQAGRAYRCYCTSEQLADRQRKAGKSLDYMLYDRACRPDKDESGIEISGIPYVVRFALPEDINQITFQDLIRGPVTFDIDQFDDFIIARSDGQPMYNFVVVIDDHDMGITQVIRGEDHISNTPKQILLYEALGFNVPQFAHLPLILGKEGNRLSKRDAATDVRDYKQLGYLPDALVNYLVRLGWSHGDQEIFSRSEMVQYFSLQEVGKSGARFDQEKLDWVNSLYIKNMTSTALITYITEYMMPDFVSQLNDFNHGQIERLIDVFKERVVTVRELIDMIFLVYHGPETYKAEDMVRWITSERKQILHILIERLALLPNADKQVLVDATKKYAHECGLKLVDLAQPLRIALIGSTSGPGVFDLMVILGIDKTIARLNRLRQAE